MEFLLFINQSILRMKLTYAAYKMGTVGESDAISDINVGYGLVLICSIMSVKKICAIKYYSVRDFFELPNITSMHLRTSDNKHR